MDYLVAGLAGVVVGAGVTLIVTLYLLQSRADRDLLERRLRALLEYRDCLSAYDLLVDADGEPQTQAIRQLARHLDGLSREYHLTAWLFDEAVRERLGVRVEDVERCLRRLRAPEPDSAASDPAPGLSGNGWSDVPSSDAYAADRLEAVLQSCRRLDDELRRVARTTLRDHRRFRFLPGGSDRDPAFRASPESESSTRGPLGRI